jgi:WD40 repeat protein
MPLRREERSGYDAFISYSRAVNGELAAKLQNWIERFATPWYRPRTLRVFRDYASLAVSEDLGGTIEQALADSRWLILLASPGSAASPWVGREVAWWRDHKSAATVCVVLTEGRLCWDNASGDWDWDHTDALPRQAQGMFRQEPLWVDLSAIVKPKQLDRSNPDLLTSVAQIVAPIRATDLDNLIGEHLTQLRRARRQRRWGIAGLVALTIAAVVAAGAALNQAQRAETQRKAAVHQRDIATSRQLAANAELEANGNPQLAALLSAAAFTIHDTPEARTSLLHQLARQTQGHTHLTRYLSGISGGVFDCEFSKDGTLLVVATTDATTVWNVASNNMIDSLAGATQAIFTPLGDEVVLSVPDQVIVQDIAQHRQIAAIPAVGIGDVPAPIALSPDGRRLAIGGIDNGSKIIVWDLATSVQMAALLLPPTPDAPPEGQGIRSLSYSPDGKTIAADANYHGIVLWDAVGFTYLGSLTSSGNLCGPVVLTFSPDGQTLAAGCSGHSAVIELLNVREGSEIARLQADGDVDALAFSPDGGTLAAGDAVKQVTLWSVAKHTRAQTLTGHGAQLGAVAFSPDGHTLVSGSDDGKVIEWDLGSRDSLVSYDIAAAGTPVAFDAAGSLLVTVADSAIRDVAVWDVARKRRVALWPGAGNPIGFVGADRVVVDGGGLFTVWNVATGRGQVLKIPRAGTGAGAGAYSTQPNALSRDGHRMATIIGDGTRVVVWDVDRDVRLALLLTPRGVASLTFPKADQLAVGEAGGPVSIWDLTTGTKTAELQVQTYGGMVLTVAASPDGHWLVALVPAGQPQTGSGCFGCGIDLWDLSQGNRQTVLTGHTITPTSVAFSPDSQTLVTTGGSETIVWSIPQRAQIATLTMAAGAVVFSPDGHTMATGSADPGAVHDTIMWELSPTTWVGRLCALAGRSMTSSEWATYVPDQAFRRICGHGS